jgi:hypothetical protein
VLRTTFGVANQTKQYGLGRSGPCVTNAFGVVSRGYGFRLGNLGDCKSWESI